jgi:hypothetical protein
MAGPSIVPCDRCGHTLGEHDRSVHIVNAGKCSECDCESYVWTPYDEDPDSAWDDYKAGYADINGNVLEPIIDEPEL